MMTPQEMVEREREREGAHQEEVADWILSLIILATIICGALCALHFDYAHPSDKEKESRDPEQMTKSKKAVRRYGFIICVLIVLFILIPGTDTIYKMLIAQQITPDAVNNTVDLVGEIVKKITEAIK